MRERISSVTVITKVSQNIRNKDYCRNEPVSFRYSRYWTGMEATVVLKCGERCNVLKVSIYNFTNIVYRNRSIDLSVFEPYSWLHELVCPSGCKPSLGK